PPSTPPSPPAGQSDRKSTTTSSSPTPQSRSCTTHTPASPSPPQNNAASSRQTILQSTTQFPAAKMRIPCTFPAAPAAPASKYIRNTAVVGSSRQSPAPRSPPPLPTSTAPTPAPASTSSTPASPARSRGTPPLSAA